MANGNDYTAASADEQLSEIRNYNGGQNQSSQNMQDENDGPGTRAIGSPNPEDLDSYLEILIANIGAYVLIQFLIGSTSLVDKEGYLYAAGTNFVTIYEPLDDRYVVCDLYSIKFVTIFNTSPIDNRMRGNNSMSFSGNRNANGGRYTGGYSSQNRRAY